jgi:methyl-accepting chemotaxis protein-1 (serine sensor receptor)
MQQLQTTVAKRCHGPARQRPGPQWLGRGRARRRGGGAGGAGGARHSRQLAPIADIIGVIDSIAFQTNILALNAAVEAAARASKAGALPWWPARCATWPRAAQAPPRDQDPDPAAERQAGSELAHNAGGTTAEVVSSIRSVSELMQEISHASSSQTNDMLNVTQAIVRMDEATQQNAALVEESAAAAAA